MVTPKTWRGYDEENKLVVSCVARDANLDINPSEVKSAVAELKATFEEQFGRIASALRNVSTTDALIVQGTSMDGAIEDTANLILQLPSQLTSGFDDLYDLSIGVHDNLQSQYNTEAKNSCRVEGVTRIDQIKGIFI